MYAVHCTDHILDLARIDVEATGDDHVLLAINQMQIAVLVEPADVPGVQPTIAEHLGGFLRPLPISFHHKCPANADFARLPIARGSALVVEQRQIQRGKGNAHRRETVRSFHIMLRPCKVTDAGRRFGLPIELHEDRPEPIERFGQPIDRHRRRTIKNCLHWPEVEAMIACMVEKAVDHCRHQECAADILGDHIGRETLRAERRKQVKRPTTQPGRVGKDAGGMRDRRDRKHPRRLGPFPFCRRHHHGSQRRTVGVHDALRTACRSSCVSDHCNVGRPGRAARRGRLRRIDQPSEIGMPCSRSECQDLRQLRQSRCQLREPVCLACMDTDGVDLRILDRPRQVLVRRKHGERRRANPREHCSGRSNHHVDTVGCKECDRRAARKTDSGKGSDRLTGAGAQFRIGQRLIPTDKRAAVAPPPDARRNQASQGPADVQAALVHRSSRYMCCDNRTVGQYII